MLCLTDQQCGSARRHTPARNPPLRKAGILFCPMASHGDQAASSPRMKTRTTFLIAWLASMLSAMSAESRLDSNDERPLLFTSFHNGGDGLHLALSRDGYRWTALKNDKPFLRS